MIFTGLFFIGHQDKSGYNKSIRSKTLYGALIILIIPLAFIFIQNLYTANLIKSYDKDAATFQDKINQEKEFIRTKADIFSSDDSIKDYLANGEYEKLSKYSENIMVAYKLSYFVITDKTGTVIVSTHDKDKIGTDYFKEIPEAGKAISNGEYSSISAANEKNPYIFSGKAINKEYGPIGAVYAGKFINDNLLADIPTSFGLITKGSSRYQSNGNLVAKGIVSNNNFDHIEGKSNDFGFITYEKNSYAFKFYKINNPENLTILDFLIINENKAFFPSLIILTSLTFLMSLAYIYFLLMRSSILNIEPVNLIPKMKNSLFLFPIIPLCLLISFVTASQFDYAHTSPQIEPKIEDAKGEPNLYILLDDRYYSTGDKINIKLYADSKGIESSLVMFKVDYTDSSLEIQDFVPSAACNKVAQKVIDKKSFTVGCELQTNSSINSPKELGVISATASEKGTASIKLMSAESYITTSLGNFSSITESSQLGQNIIIR